MMSRRAFVQLAAAASAAQMAPVNGAPPKATAALATSRSNEVLELRHFIEKTSPRGLEASADPPWRHGWDEMHKRADQIGDGQYVTGLRKLMSWFREGHTTVVPFEFLGKVPESLASGVWGSRYPIKAVPFYDGLWVTGASGEARPLLGARIQSIGGKPIGQIVTRHAGAWPAENPAWPHNWASQIAGSPGTLQGLGIASASSDKSLDFQGVFPDGRKVSARLTPRREAEQNQTSFEHAATPVARLKTKAGSGNFVEELPDGRSLLVSIDDMADVEGLPFDKFSQDIIRRSQPEQIRRVVIDLRRNGGGDNYLGEPLRHELARSRFNRPGGICVLIGPATFSAAQNFANRLERECFATYVGEPTGSAPNLVGDPAFFVGEATGITAMVATLRWFDGGPDDKRRWIFPDLLVPAVFADWVAGRDPALEAASTGAIDGEDRFASRVRYFERDSQQGRWNPFWNPA